MAIEYFDAPDVKRLVEEIVDSLELFHVVPQFVYCVRSRGSRSTRTLARIHGFGRIWQEVLHRPPAYVIEVISERYDRLSEEQKERTIIHELLHIPKGFAGGFRPHKRYVNQRIVERLYARLHERRAEENRSIAKSFKRR